MAATLDQSAHPAKHWTYADLQAFDETERYEIDDGRLISLSPAPSFSHQQVLGKLYLVIAYFLREHPLGQAVFAPLDVVFAPDNVAQPDLLFIANENAGIIKEHIDGPPDLRCGTPVACAQPAGPIRKAGAVRALWEGRYFLHSSAEQTGTVSSIGLAGLEFEIRQLF